MNKKVLSALLTGVMVVSLSGCGSAPAETKTEEPAKEAAATEETVAETSEETTEEASVEESTEEAATEDAATEEVAATDEPSGDEAFTIGYAQRATDAAYTIAIKERNQEYAKEHYPNLEWVETDAQGDVATQAANIEDLISRGVDLIMVSPLTSDGLTDAVAEAMDAGIPVVTMDREVDTPVTVKVVADNKEMGVMAADKLAEMMGGKGNIIEVCGTTGSSAAIDRQAGFEETIASKYPDIKIVDSQDCDFNSAKAASYMEDMLQKYGEGEIQAIYCHNDPMAEAVAETVVAAGRDSEGILITGMDGEEAAFQMVENGQMAFTIIYPTMSPEAMIAAYNVLTNQPQDEVVNCIPTLVSKDNVAEHLGTGLQ
ncbi:substrate-binding domain-containing protein [Butyrivibrio sp. AC2005]|uniref:substrate-binding domain-containing protein n=1 Tax=Butyrivibrio sp. AC2005 TaxID=1280672 RepID=UPI0003F798C8|nr:substrate-binding domain-containing protein [Butyrivibrio sp. AC2005]